MPDEILSLAIFEPVPGNEEAVMATMRALMAALARHGYSRDLLYRDAKSHHEYILLRYWKSEEARRAAMEDPEVLRCWAELSHEIRTIKVYEILEEALDRRSKD
jgi:quinol monooxygenase YgiN